MLARVFFAAIAVTLFLSSNLSARAETVPVCPALSDGKDLGLNDYLLGTFAGKDGWLAGTGDLNRTFRAPDVERLKLLVDALKAKGTQLVVAVMPSRPLVYPEKMPDGALSNEDLILRRNSYHAMIQAIRDSGALATDNLDVLLESKADGEVYFPRDHHWTILGAHSVAKAISEMLKDDPQFPDSQISFNNTIQSEIPYNGSYQNYVKEKCGEDNYPQETITPIITEINSGQNTPLFGNSPVPQIVIAGTSFSWKNDSDAFNFAGALETFTGEEVLNVGVNGGGLYSSLFNYLSSEDFRQSPPKYLIWETARSFVNASDDKFGQIKATLNGQCGADSQISASSTGDTTAHILIGNDISVSAANNYISMEFEDRSVIEVSIRFISFDGRTKEINVDLPPKADARGRIFSEIPAGMTNVKEISVSPINAKGLYTVDICRDDIVASIEQTISPLRNSPDLGEEQDLPSIDLTAVNSISTLEIIAFGDAFQGSPILAIELDGTVVQRQPIDATSRDTAQTVTVRIPPGTKKMRMRLDNDLNGGPDQDRNLQIVSLSLNDRLVPATTFTGAGRSARALENGDYRITGGTKWTEVPLVELAASVAALSCPTIPSIEVGPFRIGDVTVPEASLDELMAVVTVLQTNRGCGVTLTGWSSAAGSADRNLELATDRAASVGQALKGLAFEQKVTFGAPQIRSEGPPIVRIEFGPLAD